MSERTFRVFLSAVSSEFEQVRSKLASDLRSRGLEVKVQEDFRQEEAADTTLRKLHDYVEGCSAVVCVIGRRSGSLPPAAAAEPFRDMLPPALPEASYTQWELIFARHHKKRLSIYVANDDYPPDRPAAPKDDDPALQERFTHYLTKVEGLDRSHFSAADELRVLVLRERWPDFSRPKPVNLPYPSIGTLFKGRDEFLKQLREALERSAGGRAAAIVGKALHGLGGVGKTRLAVEYAWLHEPQYTALLFVSAETPQDLRRNLAALVGPLVLDLPEKDATEEEVRIAAALRWLHEHPGWFLILDNLDTPDAAAAAEGMLARLRGGHVLLTSRLAQWGAGVEPLELDVLGGEDAARFLLERTERKRRRQATDEADAAELARELDGLALALEQAGAYIQHQRLGLADYLARWRSHVPAVQGWHDERLMQYPRSVAVTWETTLQQLGPGEVALLRLLAWLAPEPVPLFLLEGEMATAVWEEAAGLVREEVSGADTASGLTRAAVPVPRSRRFLTVCVALVRTVAAWLRALCGRKKPGVSRATTLQRGVGDSLSTLANYSMVRLVGDGRSASVHRVVQEILRSRVPPGRGNDWAVLGLRLLDAARPAKPSDVRTWPKWDPLRPHVAHAAALADATGVAGRPPRS